jgi:hypothetical protein
MKHLHFSAIILTAFMAMMLALTSVRAAEILAYPPPEPEGAVHPRLDEAFVQKELDRRLIDRFKAAAGTSSNLTAGQAKAAGWGFISDHFGEIDKNRDGFVTFDDIQAFLDKQSPVNPRIDRKTVKIIP